MILPEFVLQQGPLDGDGPFCILFLITVTIFIDCDPGIV